MNTASINGSAEVVVNKYFNVSCRNLTIIKVSIVVLAIVAAISFMILIGQFYPALMGFSFAAGQSSTILCSSILSTISFALLMVCITLLFIKEKSSKKELLRKLNEIDQKQEGAQSVMRTVPSTELNELQQKAIELEKKISESESKMTEISEERAFYKKRYEILESEGKIKDSLLESHVKRITSLVAELEKYKKEKTQ